MTDLIDRLLEPDWHDPACPFLKHCYCDDGAPHDAVRHPLAREAADEIASLRARVEALRKADWLNMMPREIVAGAAFAEGCREETATAIRSGLQVDLKIRAEVAVKLIGMVQQEYFAALKDTPDA